MQNEPGGYKALVFDQGDRVSQSVSAADVADICLRALHESEVCASMWPEAATMSYTHVHAVLYCYVPSSAATTFAVYHHRMPALASHQARNKTFDVCYEYQSEAGLELYELVASMPSSSGNYLSAALSTLARNT